MKKFEGQVDRMTAARERLIELDIERFFSITLDLFKWVMATTLTINGAPLAAMLSSDYLRPMLLGPGIVFSIGLAFSVFGNLLLVRGLALAGDALFKSHWAGVAVTEQDYDNVAPEAGVNGASMTAAVLLGLSILSFLGGIIWLALSLETK
ncbi:hypothetical protein ACXYN8_08010 [Altererythrobacter sp. CAU 1778]